MKINGGCFYQNEKVYKNDISFFGGYMNVKNNTLLIKFSPLLASFFLLFFIAISLWMISEYVEKERNRDLNNWKSRLALLAEIRGVAIEDWISERQSQLNKLASNASLRLFLSDYNNREKINSEVLSAVQGHVHNLLKVSADRFGFAESESKNKSKVKEYGLAILDKDKQLVMSTEYFPKNINDHKVIIDKVYRTAKGEIIDLYAGKNHLPVYGYILPIFQIQDLQSRLPIGAVVLLLNPQKNLYGILKNRQSVTKTDESLLVKQVAEKLVYLSPVKGDFKLFYQLPFDDEQLASSYAYHNPGGFDEMVDYNGDKVLVTGRKIKNSPWILVQKISAAEALAESNKHQEFLLTTFVLIVLTIAVAFIAIWRHSTSLRLLHLTNALEARTELLDAVNDNIADNIILLDQDKKIVFINHSFSQALSLQGDEIKGQHLAAVLGKDTAEQLMNCVPENDRPSVMALLINGCERIYHVTSTGLNYGEHENAQLFVLHDISELKQEQEKREQLGQGIIGTLVKAVDMHDPYCVNHSARTRDVATEIGKAMGLTSAQLETLEMAALLANIGKLFVPKEILVKMEALSEEESKALKRHIDYAVDILSELSFDGPVVDIISQKSESLDGSGYPKGLKEDEIMFEAKILSVANAFVAMASSRAYREGRDIKEVMDILLEQSESKYDRHVVAALFHIAENKAHWKTWQSI